MITNTPSRFVTNSPRLVIHGTRFAVSRFDSVPTVQEGHYLLDHLRGKTQFLHSPPRGKRNVLGSYDAALTQLNQWKEETQQFIAGMINDACDVSAMSGIPKPHQSAARRAMRDLLTEFYHFRFTTIPSIKSLELLAEPATTLYGKLRQHFEQALATFVGEVVALFEAMQARGVVGSVRRDASGEHCEFTYFRSKVRVEYDTLKETTKTTQSGLNFVPQSEHRWWQTKYVTKRLLRSGEFVFQHVHYTQLLSFITETPLSNWSLPLPPRILQTIIRMPQFLFDYGSITTGHLEHARIVAQDVGRMPWEYEQVHVREEQIRHYDPMVRVGPWVVAGWCQQEHPTPTKLQRLLALIPRARTIEEFREHYSEQILQLAKEM